MYKESIDNLMVLRGKIYKNIMEIRTRYVNGEMNYCTYSFKLFQYNNKLKHNVEACAILMSHMDEPLFDNVGSNDLYNLQTTIMQ